ncbi:WecB/TagA/CpsF family glycosyltransferase [Thalassococcus lentus]|uniref:WecB/TagA/CpsF family glycosyltransferase n=1 Tax=Thalassococcus lentus TaxID=1210524 RepID=A0ABT4XNI3_9RHOB|nr:WecB/TagA/CpsF family glycosyltransferase [Thalassococcus lentus]MDA7423506.1 WecB/TagA/CpsF family glycosyltransferase [Thalassococcus lentus]
MQFTVSGETIVVNVPTWSALESRVSESLAKKKGFALATINLDHLVKLRTSPEFLDAYLAQDMVVADGNPIVWMSKAAARPVELIPGSDAILPLARIAADQGVPVAFVGSTQESLGAAKDFLEQEVPGLQVACCIAPPMGFDPAGSDAAAIMKQVEISGAGMCFIALGAPKQEIFAATGRRVCPTVGFASIGAGLDFFAGTQKRAPSWTRKFALEWLWRGASNPKRLGPRYLKCVMIFPGQMWNAFKMRFG